MEFVRAVNSNNISKVKKLIDDGANINSTDNNVNTVLMIASDKGHKEIVQMLIRAGSDVNVRNFKGDTALILASEKGHEEIVQMLLKAKADVNIKNRKGNTALISASGKGHGEIVQMLIKAKADVNIRTNIGSTALIAASFNGHREIVQMLIKANADINIRPHDGYTALISAAYNGHENIIKLLFKAGVRRDYNELKNNIEVNPKMLDLIFKDRATTIQKVFKGRKTRKITNKILREISIMPRGGIKSFAWRNPTTKKIELFTLKMAHNGHLILKNKKHFEGISVVPKTKEEFIRRVRSLSINKKKEKSMRRFTSPTKEHKLEQKPFGLISTKIIVL